MFLLAVITISVSHAQTPVTPSGDGLTTATAYQITELGNLLWMSETVTSSTGMYYRLLNDIDASDTANWNDDGTTADTLEGFPPIGTYSDPNFCGFFDGAGHKITGLKISRVSIDYVGLFGCIGYGGTVVNLGLEGGSITGYDCVGVLCGYNCGAITNCFADSPLMGMDAVGDLVGENDAVGTITNCYATGTVTGSYAAGGLLGSNDTSGTITNCHTAGTIVGVVTESDDFNLAKPSAAKSMNARRRASGGGLTSEIGGLAGYNGGMIVDCYSDDTVAGTNASSYVGGLVGFNGSTIQYCFATSAVTAASGTDGGGLVGFNSGAISKCYAAGTMVGTGIQSYTGGLVGYTTGLVDKCYATGAVTALSYGVGGLAGYNDGPIANCYATGMVVAIDLNTQAGGLVGAADGEMTNCYAAGAVTGSFEFGGLLGRDDGSTITDCYWDMEATGQATSAGGTGESTSQMHQLATFQPGSGTGSDDWNFDAIWGISAAENDGYPYLRIVPAVASFSVDNGAAKTPVPAVTLDNKCTNSPTAYMASETPDFAGAAWRAYGTSPGFTLAKGSGTKKVYFKVRSTLGESKVTSDTIYLQPNPAIFLVR